MNSVSVTLVFASLAAAATALLSTYQSADEPTGHSLLPALARIGGRRRRDKLEHRAESLKVRVPRQHAQPRAALAAP